MNFKSRLLEQWTEELIADNQKYYLNMKEEAEELDDLRRLQYKSKNDIETRLNKELGLYEEDDYEKRQALKKEIANLLYDELAKLGFTYTDREYFVKNHSKGFGEYTVQYKGMTLHSTETLRKMNGSRLTTYSIKENYFVKVHSISDLALVDNKDVEQLMAYAEKESRNYVKSVIVRVEKRFGTILKVVDSYASNMMRVMFECENGTCYLEMIMAGGYNIQRLHNRIIIKQLKK